MKFAPAVFVGILLEEILPEVEKTVKLRHDAAGRAIAGQSSGGICAFTVAWERPYEFSRVISWFGLHDARAAVVPWTFAMALA